VDSSKKASTLDRACASAARPEPLRIFLQVNTSGEESMENGANGARFTCILCRVGALGQSDLLFISVIVDLAKSGMLPRNVLEVAQHVVSTCPHLKLAGLMTIGSPNPALESGENPDFKVRINTLVA